MSVRELTRYYLAAIQMKGKAKTTHVVYALVAVDHKPVIEWGALDPPYVKHIPGFCVLLAEEHHMCKEMKKRLGVRRLKKFEYINVNAPDVIGQCVIEHLDY